MKTTMTAAILGLLALPVMAQEERSESDPRRLEVLNKLNTMRITVDFANVTLEEAIGYLRDFSGLNIVVDAEVYKNQSEDQLKVTLKVKDLLLKSILKLMLNSRELTAMYKELANSTAYADDFNDITQGGAQCKTGFDECTGIGSPKTYAGK